MERNKVIEEMLDHGWSFPAHIWDCFSEYEQSFLIGELTGESRRLSNYLDRLNYLGFEGMDNVLDAGCGYGQWSIAMSPANTQIVGVDINTSRLLVATEMSKEMNISNTRYQYARLEDLPFPANTFDGIFCYSVFMFTQMPRTLQEFHRVLRPGGKLYINTDTIGWYAHLLRDVKRDRFNALKMILKTFAGKTQGIVVREGWLKRQLLKAGFDIVGIGSEGETTFITDSTRKLPIAFYPKEYYGMKAILEIISRKR